MMAAQPHPACPPRPALREVLRDARLPGGLLALGLALVFHADLFGGSDLLFRVTRDISPPISLYPWSVLAAKSWVAGLFPLWNPYNFLGLPLAGNYQSSVFSPLMLPLYLPLEWVTVPWLLGRLWVAGMGAWWLGRRIGLANWPATIAALAFGLTGYFTQHVAVQHVVIDLLLPFFFIAAHDLAARRRLRDFFAFVGLTLLALLGGQPGAALFTLAMAYGYALLVATAPSDGRAGRLLLIAGAGALASAVATIQLLPFFEFIPRAWNFHLPGYGTASIPPSGAVTALVPGFYGALDRAREVLPLIQIAPYYGFVPAVLAASGLFAPRRLVEKYFVFGLLVSTFILLGLPPLSWLVALPGFDKLSYIKYLQPVVALTLALLAGRGAQELLEGKSRFRIWAAAKLAAGAVIVAAVVLYPRHPDHAMFMVGAVVTACATAFVTVAIAIFAGQPARARRSVIALTVLCLIELVLASSVNRTLYFRNVAREDWTPLRKVLGCSDYASCAAIAGRARYAASDDLLIPEQNILVPYRDIGAAEVMFIKESYQLVRGMTGKTEAEFVHDYLKYHTFQYTRDGQISNYDFFYKIGIRSFLSRLPWRWWFGPTISIDQLPILSFGPEAVHHTRLDIGGDEREGIFAHAPSRISPPGNFIEEPGFARSGLAVGVDPRAARLPGDGVWFAVFSDNQHLQYARYLDPRRGDKSWVQTELSCLARDLVLTTLPGRSYENDWAVWGPFVRSNPDLGGIRSWSPIFSIAINEREWVLAGGAYGLQSARFKLYPERDVLAIIHSDAYYPGWKVFVDGVERRIIPNQGRRGVKVDPKDQMIEFLYQPWSFRVALWLCLTSLLVVAAVGMRARRRG